MKLFGLFSTIVLFCLFKRMNCIKKVPIILSVGFFLIFILKIFNIQYETYYYSANILTFLIAPATIALAYPMYKNSNILMVNKRIFYFSLLFGAIFAFIITFILAKFLSNDYKLVLSLLPKSTTMPIALEISKIIGGYQEITSCVVVLTGVFGGVFGHSILKFFKIKNDIAQGIAMGTASHIIGTSACAEKKKIKQTSASTIALILVGLFSAIIIPIFVRFFQ